MSISDCRLIWEGEGGAAVLGIVGAVEGEAVGEGFGEEIAVRIISAEGGALGGFVGGLEEAAESVVVVGVVDGVVGGGERLEMAERSVGIGEAGTVGFDGLGEEAGGVVAMGGGFSEGFLEAGKTSHGIVGFFEAAGAFGSLRGMREDVASEIVGEFFVEKAGDVGGDEAVERIVALDGLEAGGIGGGDAAAVREMFVAGGGREAASISGGCGTAERIVGCVFDGCLAADIASGGIDEACTVVMVQCFYEKMAFGV